MLSNEHDLTRIGFHCNIAAPDFREFPLPALRASPATAAGRYVHCHYPVSARQADLIAALAGLGGGEA